MTPRRPLWGIPSGSIFVSDMRSHPKERMLLDDNGSLYSMKDGVVDLVFKSWHRRWTLAILIRNQRGPTPYLMHVSCWICWFWLWIVGGVWSFEWSECVNRGKLSWNEKGISKRLWSSCACGVVWLNSLGPHWQSRPLEEGEGVVDNVEFFIECDSHNDFGWKKGMRFRERWKQRITMIIQTMW